MLQLRTSHSNIKQIGSEMFQRKSAILFSILGLGTLLGFISGVAPGYFLKSSFDHLFLCQ